MTVAIRATDRVRDVLARDPALLDVLIAQSPRFAMLRKPAIRRTAAALATVEQAATVAGIPADELVSALNDAIGAPAGITVAPVPSPVQPTAQHVPRPLDRPIVEVDVRDDLRAKREPFAKIMAAVRALDPGAVLRVRAIFEPAPLVGMLGQRGFACETQRHGEEDWSLWAWRRDAPPADPWTERRADASADADASGTSESEVWLDVRDLEPPEPMVRTLAALETLPAGRTLIHMNTRVPQFLLPMLVERGFVYEIEHLDSGNVLVRIRHTDDVRST